MQSVRCSDGDRSKSRTGFDSELGAVWRHHRIRWRSWRCGLYNTSFILPSFVMLL